MDWAQEFPNQSAGTYDPDNATDLTCFLDAAISAAAPAEDAE